MTPAEAHITVKNLTMAYGSFVIQRDLTFTVQRGDIFIIMGGSGCGKSTLLRHLIGLKPPAQGEVLDRRRELLGGLSRGAGPPQAPLRGAVSERRPVELDDAGRERGAAARAIYRR